FFSSRRRHTRFSRDRSSDVCSSDLDFEMASLDIWHWQDPKIQPQQLKEQSREERRTYLGIIYTNKKDNFIPLANLEMPYISISRSEERRVGKECRFRRSEYVKKEKR